MIVPVRSEEYEVSVCAFNSVGCSAHRRITLDASRSHDVPAVKSLWVYSDDFSLWVSWEHEFTTANVSEFAIEWSAMTDREHRRWERVPGSTFTVCLPGIEAKQTYIISVFPVYGSLCGPPASISADLQHGALLDLVRFRLLYVSSSSVAVQWTWQEAEPSVSVLQYRLVLNGPLETQTLTVFPNKEQHLFLQLHPNTRYSIHVQERNHSRELLKGQSGHQHTSSGRLGLQLRPVSPRPPALRAVQVDPGRLDTHRASDPSLTPQGRERETGGCTFLHTKLLPVQPSSKFMHFRTEQTSSSPGQPSDVMNLCPETAL
ncbi:uncharacterized protein LOC113052813 [Carassius auratus]|uniref:Uncharacterized protein LOC113052813 n=1 Tax=Carassius auratus TaxID=7957 RepID=A0A6P6KL82_CARAU|nr:uncharacterized protein LOC113052813 [Carassius auratus]